MPSLLIFYVSIIKREVQSCGSQRCQGFEADQSFIAIQTNCTHCRIRHLFFFFSTREDYHGFKEIQNKSQFEVNLKASKNPCQLDAFVIPTCHNTVPQISLPNTFTRSFHGGISNLSSAAPLMSPEKGHSAERVSKLAKLSDEKTDFPLKLERKKIFAERFAFNSFRTITILLP